MTPYRIVVVEDEGLIALDLTERLRAAGYQVVEVADNADSAIAAVATHHPDLVLMDILIRGLHDGIWAARQIRRRFDTPIIFVTALADEATILRARMAEPYGYLVKPFHNIDFRSQIETVVWKHREDRKARMKRAWLEATVRSAADALVAVGPEGEVVLMNPEAERITGFTSLAAVGRQVTEVLPLADERTGMKLLTPLLAVRDGREPSSRMATYVLRTENREPLLLEVNASVQRDDDGLVGLILTFRDVTNQRRRMDKASSETNTTGISRVADAFGKELSIHLNRVAGLAHRMMAEPTSSDARDTHRAALAALAVVRRLQELGSTRPPELVPLALSKIIAETIAKVDAEDGPGWTWVVQLPQTLPSVLTNEAGCGRHLRELIAEARAGMPLGGEIRITAKEGSSPASPQLLLTVHAIPRRQSDAKPGALSSGWRVELARHFMTLCGGSLECALSREHDLVFTLGFCIARTAAAIGAGA